MDNKQIYTELRKLAKTSKHDDVEGLRAMAIRIRGLEAFNSREVKLLVDAVKADVLEDLTSQGEAAVREILYERLASRISSESDATHEEACWAVDIWAKALSGKATEIAHAQPNRKSLSWGDDESGKTDNLSAIRASAPAPTMGSAMPNQAAPAQKPKPPAPASWPPPMAPTSWPPPPESDSWPPQLEQASAPQLVYAEGAYDNTSGTNGGLPLEIVGFRWNWGAFGFNWIWMLFNGMTLWGALMFSLYFVPFAGAIANFGISIYLGRAGHKLAWRKRRFESVDQFMSVQRAWTRWWIAWFVLHSLVMLITAPSLYRSYYKEAQARAAYQQYLATHRAQ